MVIGLTRQMVGNISNETTDFSTSNLPEVTDPEATYAGITRQD